MAKHYTIGDLMSIDSLRQDKANKSSVVLKNTYHELKKDSVMDKFRKFLGGKSIIQRYNIIFRFEVTSDTGNKHIVFIRLDPDFKLMNVKKNRVDIYCDCADFKYRSAYILNQNNSLFYNDSIEKDLGKAITEAPTKKSTTTSILCKHSYAALSWLVDNYVNIMKTI